MKFEQHLLYSDQGEENVFILSSGSQKIREEARYYFKNFFTKRSQMPCLMEYLNYYINRLVKIKYLSNFMKVTLISLAGPGQQ